MNKGRRGWRIYALAGVFAALVVLLDVFLTRGRNGGLCPENAQRICYSSDFPSFYSELLKSDFCSAMSEEAPQYQAEWQLDVRKTTGIRPTPMRWRVWLGRQMIAATSADGAGVCVRPGVLLRVADTLAGAAGWRPRVRQFGPYYYGWRDGLLVFSRAESYVLASLDAQPFRPSASKSGPHLSICETRQASTALEINAGKSITVTGWFEGDGLTVRKKPLEFAQWPQNAVVACTAGAAATKLSDLSILAGSVWQVVERHADLTDSPRLNALRQLASHAAEKWGVGETPPQWDAGVAESALVLFDVDDAEVVPVPVMGLVLQMSKQAEGAHPLISLGGGNPGIACEWQGHPGLQFPVASEKVTFCLSSLGQCWLAASQEPAMARLMQEVLISQSQNGRGITADATLSVDWRQASSHAITLGRKWASLGVLPQIGSEGFEANVMPLLRALGRLGEAAVEFRQGDGRIEFKGALSSGAAQ